MSGLFNGSKYPPAGIAIADVAKILIDEMEELRMFKQFVLQDPEMAVRYEKFKTFEILKKR